AARSQAPHVAAPRDPGRGPGSGGGDGARGRAGPRGRGVARRIRRRRGMDHLVLGPHGATEPGRAGRARDATEPAARLARPSPPWPGTSRIADEAVRTTEIRRWADRASRPPSRACTRAAAPDGENLDSGSRPCRPPCDPAPRPAPPP